MYAISWQKVSAISRGHYVCGFCGIKVGPDQGYVGKDSYGETLFILICPHCQKPTFLHGKVQVPEPLYGNNVSHVPTEVYSLYNEARRCMSVSAYTAAVLVCRKLLMHIAVEKNAPEGKSFLEYVEYLCDNRYVPPDGKGWVDHIRKMGNEANHEIAEVSRTDAEELISFSEMLLRFVFELPARIPHTP